MTKKDVDIFEKLSGQNTGEIYSQFEWYPWSSGAISRL